MSNSSSRRQVANSLISKPPLSLHCTVVRSTESLEGSVDDRQQRIPGFSQKALSTLTVLLVGAGAFGGEVAEGLVREGVGHLKILDFDTVAVSNLNRQFFLEKDVYTPKAWALARNLQPHGAMGTHITAYPLSYEQATEDDVDLASDIIIAAVDDSATRVRIAQDALEQRIPALFGGASEQADYARLFVQDVGQACFGCAFPEEVDGGRNPCPGSPAAKPLFKGLGYLALIAVHSLVMDRPRNWQLHTLCPADGTLTQSGAVPRNSDCPLCGRLS